MVGGTIVVALIVAMGHIIKALGQLAEEALEYMAVGAAVIVGIGGIFWLLGEMMTPFMEMCIRTGEHGGDALKGAGIVALLIGSMLAIAIALGAMVLNPVMPIVLASGAAVLVGLGLIFLEYGKCAPPFIDLCINAGLKSKEIKAGSTVVIDLINAMAGVAKELGKQCGIPFFNSALEDGVEVLQKLSLVITEMSKALIAYSKAI